MEKETVVAHRSFSSFTSWIRCGKAWQLERNYKHHLNQHGGL
jgi:uncharacterized C2H2 Zn-finger protein